MDKSICMDTIHSNINGVFKKVTRTMYIPKSIYFFNENVKKTFQLVPIYWRMQF